MPFQVGMTSSCAPGDGSSSRTLAAGCSTIRPSRSGPPNVTRTMRGLKCSTRRTATRRNRGGSRRARTVVGLRSDGLMAPASHLMALRPSRPRNAPRRSLTASGVQVAPIEGRPRARGDVEGVGRAARRECLAYAGRSKAMLVAEAGAQRRGVNTRYVNGSQRHPHDLTTYHWGPAGCHHRHGGGDDQTMAPCTGATRTST